MHEMKLDDKIIGQNVLNLRIARGITQKDLALDSDLNRSVLSRIEKGIRSLSVVELARLADALGVDAAQLLETRGSGVPQDPSRVVIEGVSPVVDAGIFPVKRVVGEMLVVEADIFADGHDVLAAVLRHNNVDEDQWTEVPFTLLGNDRWRATFPLAKVGRHSYTIEAWVDLYASWRRDLEKRVAADQNVSTELLIGAKLVEAAAERARGRARVALIRYAADMSSADHQAAIRLGLDPRVAELVGQFPDRTCGTYHPRELSVVVEPVRARTGAWYEMFPRSAAYAPDSHGNFRDCIARLPHIAEMGFDVLYLPPIHPIGTTNRKGPNNQEEASVGDPGSPWAIGSSAGGHKAINPDLGTLDDFRDLVTSARSFSIDIALDIAFQCSPDHPYVTEHPSWFRWRPDGTVQYAENPPKKYQDIFPLNFESEDWRGLWQELLSVFLYWIEQDVRIFRVDNPHTKPLRFWAWLIEEVKRLHPDVIFLAEAFTRPRIMYNLAKIGFSQSYTYFTWRNTSSELRDYFTELTKTGVKDFFRPNLWPNTPDILTQYLQFGGQPAFMIRLILAATFGASYGVYGPPFELCLGQARDPGTEEYIDSEKYEVRYWELDQPHSLSKLISRINHVRRSNPALQANENLTFHGLDNDQLLCYSKSTADLENVILTVVNLDPQHVQSGWVKLDLDALGLTDNQPFQVHDLLSDEGFVWTSAHNYVEVDPRVLPAHVFLVRRNMKREKDFDYYQ